MTISSEYLLSATQVFTFLFIMLGPLRLLGPFSLISENLSDEQIRDLSMRAVFIALATLTFGALIGSFLLEAWMVRPAVLLMTGGIIFFLVALLRILPLQERPSGNVVALVNAPTARHLALKLLITPYGAATAIVLIAVSGRSSRTIVTLALLLLIMFLNLIAMRFVRSILKASGTLALEMLDVVMSVLQAALALEIIIRSWLFLR